MRFALVLLCAVVMTGAEYPLCLLTAGPEAGKIEAGRAKELQAQHMAHIGRMFEMGKLESAGPVAGFAGVRGIFLFRGTMAEAQELAAKDPKVIAGDLALDCHLWLGPEGVGAGYRRAMKEPGFTDKMSRKVAVLLKDGRVAGFPVLVSGTMRGGTYKWFGVLDTDAVAAVKEKGLEGEVFVWFHDARVWP
jgi:hypothetical protein